jgi:hypothetical protein
MDGGGGNVSRHTAAAPGSSTTARASARLGLTLRAVLVAPKQGFESAVAAADRRARASRRPAEGISPYILSALGGAALFLLWLKVGALFDLRDAPRSSFRAVYLVGVVGVGAVLGLACQSLWAASSALILKSGSAPRRNLRLMWGAAAMPQVFALLLLPLDLAIAGSGAFTTTRLEDPLGAAWAALSIALGGAFAAWAAYLFVRGVAITSKAGLLRVIGAVSVALVVLAVTFGPFIVSTRVMS